MMNIYNAVSDTLAELDFDLDSHIRPENGHYVVTFQSRQNGNNRIVMRVTYNVTPGNDVLDDEEWEESVDIQLLEHPGFRQASAELLMEYLASTIDPDYFDIDSEDESDDDDETIASQPLTPPPSRARLA